MFFDERRIHFLRDRVKRRLKVCQADSFYSYYRLLTSREGKKELTALLEHPDRQRNKFLSAPNPSWNFSRKQFSSRF